MLHAPISPDILKYKRERWLDHEKELSLLKNQYKHKIERLTKLLIARKSVGDLSNKPNRFKKKVVVISNRNKSIEFDALIQHEMNRLSNKYEFEEIHTHRLPQTTLEEKKQHLIDQIRILLNSLQVDIEQKEKLIEDQREKEARSVEYYEKMDQITQFRSRKRVLETMINELQLGRTPEISIRLMSEAHTEMPLSPNESLQLQQKMKALEKSQNTNLQRHLEHQQKIADKVKKEMGKLGVLPKKKAHEMDINFDYQKIPSSLSPKKERFESPVSYSKIIPRMKSLQSIVPPNLSINDQSHGKNPSEYLSRIIGDCEELQGSCDTLDGQLKRQLKRKNIKLKKLNNQLYTIKEVNFPDNKMILI